MNTLMSASNAAMLLGISERTLSRMRLEGRGPIFLKLGKRILYDPEDLKSWVKGRRFSNTSQYRARAI